MYLVQVVNSQNFAISPVGFYPVAFCSVFNPCNLTETTTPTTFVVRKQDYYINNPHHLINYTSTLYRPIFEYNDISYFGIGHQVSAHCSNNCKSPCLYVFDVSGRITGTFDIPNGTTSIYCPFDSNPASGPCTIFNYIAEETSFTGTLYFNIDFNGSSIILNTKSCALPNNDKSLYSYNTDYTNIVPVYDDY